MTTKAAGFESERRMYVHDDLTWDQFTQKFREAFGRDMTVDEYHWFYGVWTANMGQKQAKANAAAA